MVAFWLLGLLWLLALVAFVFCGFCGFWLLWCGGFGFCIDVGLLYFYISTGFLVKSLLFSDFYIEISRLMSFLLHSSLLMTLVDKISNAFPLENHTDHQKKHQKTSKKQNTSILKKNQSQLKSRPTIVRAVPVYMTGYRLLPKRYA